MTTLCAPIKFRNDLSVSYSDTLPLSHGSLPQCVVHYYEAQKPILPYTGTAEQSSNTLFNGYFRALSVPSWFAIDCVRVFVIGPYNILESMKDQESQGLERALAFNRFKMKVNILELTK